jgi:FkbM family methyltransferase
MTDQLAPATAKDVVLQCRDVAMSATAAKYDLDSKEDLARSCEDLSTLFFHLADMLEVDLFIEAGAKDAGTSRRAARLLKADRIVAFEANPYTHKRFADINADPAAGVDYRHLALSDSAGTVTFNVHRSAKGTPRADGQASLLKRETAADNGFVEVTVDSTTLDDAFEAGSFARAALWVDVEGATQVVLPGGRATLEQTAVVMIEVEDRRYWGETQWLRDDVVSYLYDRGLVPVARDFQSRYQYNIVFVRHDLLTIDRVRWALTRFGSRAGEKRVRTPKVPAEKTVPATVLARELRSRVVARGKREVGRIRSSH